MKQYPIQLPGIIGICFLMLTACSDETPVDNDSVGKDLVVSAEIIPSSESKAGLANAIDKLSFGENDEILISRSGQSKIYKLSSAKQWLPQSGGDNLAVDGTEQTYTAIHPSGFTNILEDQHAGSGENYAQSNKLISEVTTASNYVPFKFRHAFAKITIVVSYKSNSKRKNVTATLVGDGIRTDKATEEETIRMLRTMPEDGITSISHTFICILHPGETRGFKLTVKGDTDAVGNNPAEDESYTQTAKKFTAGYNYIYNFSSNDNLILTGVTVVDFSSGGEANDVGNAT